MSDIKFNTRIQLKFDTKEEWEKNNTPLKKGELAVVLEKDTAKGTTKVRLKAGIDDGITGFNSLPYIGKDGCLASEVTGLLDFIKENDVKYQLNQVNDSKGQAVGLSLQSAGADGIWGDVDPSINFTAGMTTIATNQADTVKTTLLGTEGDSASTNSIIGSKKYADQIALDTVKALLATEVPVTENTVITGLKIDESGKLIVSTGNITTMPGFIEALNKKQDNLTFSGAYNSSTNKVVLQDALSSGLSEKQDKLEFNTAYDSSTNKVATMTDIKNSTKDIAGAMHYIGTVAILPVGEEITVNGNKPHTAKNGDVVVYDGTGEKKGLEFVYSGNGIWRELGSENSYILKGNEVIQDSYIGTEVISTNKIKGLNAEIAKIKSNGENITNIGGRLEKAEGSISTHNTDIINAKSDLTNIKASSVSGAGKIVTDITTDKGKITATKGDLDIADLVQKTINTIVFDCGNSIL